VGSEQLSHTSIVLTTKFVASLYSFLVNLPNKYKIGPGALFRLRFYTNEIMKILEPLVFPPPATMPLPGLIFISVCKNMLDGLSEYIKTFLCPLFLAFFEENLGPRAVWGF